MGVEGFGGFQFYCFKNAFLFDEQVHLVAVAVAPEPESRAALRPGSLPGRRIPETAGDRAPRVAGYPGFPGWRRGNPGKGAAARSSFPIGGARPGIGPGSTVGFRGDASLGGEGSWLCKFAIQAQNYIKYSFGATGQGYQAACIYSL